MAIGNADLKTLPANSNTWIRIPMLTNVFAPVIISAAERRWVSDSMLRRGIRYLCKKRLKDEKVASEVLRQERVSKFLQDCESSPVAVGTNEANEQHYEVPAEFYAQVLGPNFKYSCCYFEDETASLEQAEARSLELSCEHAQLSDGMKVLELGCGWGSLTLWMLEHYPNMRVTAVSNSASQREHIVNIATERNLASRLEVLTCDINQLSLDKKFDRVVSIEMFEHVRNHRTLFHKISKWLADNGKLFTHVFCHKNTPYLFSTEGAANWMGRYFFTGGIMPSADLFAAYDQHLQIEETWKWSGAHYQMTSEAWLKNLDRNAAQLRSVMRENYGAQAELWLQRWRIFFLAVAELFGYDQGNEWFVQHYLFQKNRSS